MTQEVKSNSRAFLISFSYCLAGDTSGGKRMEFKDRVIFNIFIYAVLYTPVLNNIGCTFVMVSLIKKNIKDGTNLFEDPLKRANFAQLIIGALGLGGLLLPVHVVTTIVRAGKNSTLSESEKIIKFV